MTDFLSQWPVLQQVISFIVGLCLVFVVYKIINKIIFGRMKKAVEKEPKLNTIYSFFRKLVRAVILLIGVAIVVFAVFPEARGVTASLFVAAGFASIVIGLAAQSSLSNLMAGILIVFSQPFRLGEAVTFKQEYGTVEEVKLINTVIRTWDNRRLVVPNEMFLKEAVVNYTMVDSTKLVPVFVQVSHESDLEKAMSIMVDVAKRHPDCMPVGDLPNAVVMEFTDLGVKLRLLSRAKDQPTAFSMTRDLLFQIKKEFDANGIEIPYIALRRPASN